MIWVVEDWHFRPEVAADVTAAMQELDDLLGPGAHAHPGWCGHARFFAEDGDASRGLMLYPWRSRNSHRDLVAREEPRLAGFYDRYCVGGRRIRYYDELAVDVGHEAGAPHAAGPDGGGRP